MTLQDYVKRSRPNSGNNRKGKAAKPRASVTLKDLVDLSVILPGRNKISVSYKGVNYVASLGKDGIIVYQGIISGCHVSESSKQVSDILLLCGSAYVCLV